MPLTSFFLPSHPEFDYTVDPNAVGKYQYSGALPDWATPEIVSTVISRLNQQNWTNPKWQQFFADPNSSQQAYDKAFSYLLGNYAPQSGGNFLNELVDPILNSKVFDAADAVMPYVTNPFVVGGAASIAGALGGAASGAVGDAGAAAGGSGAGSAAGGAIGEEGIPTTFAGYSTAGDGTLVANFSAPAAGGNALAGTGTAGAAAGAGAANSLIDESLANDVYGDMLNPPIEPVSVPPGVNYVPGPGNGVPLPADPGQIQPMPSPPDFSTPVPTPSTNNPLVDAGTDPATIPNSGNSLTSDVPDWLKALLPSLDALGQYATANKASDAQAKAYQAAIDEQKREYDLARGDYAPYLQTGTAALGRLNNLASGDMTGFYTSPDYNFRRDEGTRGIENQFSASGGALSGNALKALTDYNSNLASGEFGNYWNRQAGLAGVGQTATGQVSQLGQQNANATGNALIGQGDARATGIYGKGGAFGNLFNNLYKSFYPTGP